MTVLNHLGNPAYGLTAAPPAAWEHRAVCGTQDPDLWHGADSQVNWQRIAEAKHICQRHCPVLEECARDIGPMRTAVVGGVFYNSHNKVSDYQPVANRCRICALPRPGARPKAA